MEQLLPLLPIKHIAQVTGVHWHAIKGTVALRL
ncbi:hypothetical protein L1D41_06105 [Vibrio harveyi]|nr:hypothetical protein [Vibrio harveyi]MCG9667293.1 hypothetical protein [Vibrio harveyi]